MEVRFLTPNFTRPLSAAVWQSFCSDTSGLLGPEGFLSEASNQREKDECRHLGPSDAIFGSLSGDGPHPWPNHGPPQHSRQIPPQRWSNTCRLPGIWENMLTWKKSKCIHKQKERERKKQKGRETEIQKTKNDVMILSQWNKYLTDKPRNRPIHKTNKGNLREQALLEMKTKIEELTHSVEELLKKL